MINSMLLAAAVAADKATPHGEQASSGGLPQMDVTTFPSQLFWLAVTFSCLFFAMRLSILPRLGGIIEERKDRIADDLDQAAEFKQQAEEAQAAYDDALSQARAKSQNIAAETRSAIDDQISTMQSSMESELAEKVEEAELRISAMKQTAQNTVHEAAIDTTRSIVEALIEEVPTREAVESAIESYSR